uniref:AlNc14C103G6107 protein n=1 Tax=Albugo laibachii Nc14 TaxID=890382 RepID=F0WHQ0_9STRA|nr:AlNc14C103G6107 [Albugo laibachii Nc14]CCA23719.1 AlNc14C204G8769 [Albugo laibachii Nc14]|eukprot:CCA23719.1 AlNc14C204G8769 [Albugo laibachii Nc14]
MHRVCVYLLPLYVLWCFFTLTAGILALKFHDKTYSAIIDFKDLPESFPESFPVSVSFNTRDTITRSSHDRLSNVAHFWQFQYILHLAMKANIIQPNTAFHELTQHVEINIWDILTKPIVTSVCIDLSKRLFGVNQESCLLPLDENALDHKHLLSGRKLLLRKIAANYEQKEVQAPLTIDLEDTAMMIPENWQPFIEKVIAQKVDFQLLLYGGPPVKIAHYYFSKSEREFTFCGRQIEFYEGNEWRLGQPFLIAYNVEIFEGHYRIGHSPHRRMYCVM